MMSNLTEHDFQDESEKWSKHWENCRGAERDYVKSDVGQVPQS
jgi:hypothetical protein